MRKVVAALIIVLVTMIYFVSVRNNAEQKSITLSLRSQVEKTVEYYKENYPVSAESVAKGHAEMMKLQYSNGIDDADIAYTVEGVRLFYCEETLLLNDEDTQTQALMHFTEMGYGSWLEYLVAVIDRSQEDIEDYVYREFEGEQELESIWGLEE